MSSIPFKHKKSHEKDIGPTYYSPNRLDTKSQFSVSTKGSSGMVSSTERFPLQHNLWGYPDPAQYAPDQSFKLMTQKKDATTESATFQTTSRDNYFYQQPSTQTPDPGTYHLDKNAAWKLAQIRNKRRTYEKAKNESQTQQLIREAAACNKSISRYLIESDPNYIPPPKEFTNETLDARPIQTENDYQTFNKQKKSVSKNYTISQINQLQNKYQLEVLPKEELLAKEIQDEIDQTKQFYGYLYQNNDTEEYQDQLSNKYLPKPLETKPLEEEGIAFNKRITNKAEECMNVLQQQKDRESFRAPNSYNVKTQVLKTHSEGIELNRQFGREDIKVKTNDIPGVGTYNIKAQTTKQSFLVNDDNKYVV